MLKLLTIAAEHLYPNKWTDQCLLSDNDEGNDRVYLLRGQISSKFCQEAKATGLSQ